LPAFNHTRDDSPRTPCPACKAEMESSVVKPITPDDVVGRKEASIPSFVLEAFNDLIGGNWNGHESTFKQSEVVAEILKRAPPETTSGMLYERRWLDVEPIYERAGWIVVYDKPAYCETYPATFTFKKRRKTR
jgi:hypothetical protein